MEAGAAAEDNAGPSLPWLTQVSAAAAEVASLSPDEQRALDEAAAELVRQNEALRQHQQELEGALQRFASLFSSVPLPLFVLDADGLVLESNAKALEVFRPLESDPPLNFLWPLVAPVSQHKVAAAMAQATSTGAAVATELQLLRPSGALQCELHFSRLDRHDEPTDAEAVRAQLVCAVVDQTPTIQLRQSQKMQALGTLAGGVAHDFNNILAAILGNAELAMQELAAATDTVTPARANLAAPVTSLQQIQQAALRGRSLVRQILAFSRQEVLSLRPTSLAEVVSETLALVRLAMPPQMKLQVELAPNLPVVLAERTQAGQALLNLCTNAIQAMAAVPGASDGDQAVAPSRGLLHIGLEHDPGSQRLRLSVRDTGPGIADAHQDRVFEPFFTTKPVGQGTGLGLSVVHGIMASHNGSVELKSIAGEGCEFSLYFPIANDGAVVASTPAPDSAPDSAPAVALGNLAPVGSAAHPVGGAIQVPKSARILVVDDDAALVFLLERALRRQGHVVTTADSASAALALLHDSAQAFDLLLSDHNMPGTSGLELLRQVRVLRPGLPVVLTSGFISTELETQALAAGAAALIAKPSSPQEVAEALAPLLA